MGAKIARWIFFTILCSLIPIGTAYVYAVATRLPAPLSVATEHGELFLLSTSFAAASLGEIIGEASKWLSLRIVFAGLSTLILFGSAVLFTLVTHVADPIDGVPLLITVSYFVFPTTCIISMACIALSEVK